MLWNQNNSIKRKEMEKKYRIKNADKMIERMRRYRENNRVKYRESVRRSAAKARNTPKGALNGRMSSGIYHALRGEKKGMGWEKLVGYSVSDLKRHIEKQFQPGMSWDNVGEWEIDHIIPKVAFNYETPEDIDFRRCWGLKNLRPLWKPENRSKHAKISIPFQPALLMSI